MAIILNMEEDHLDYFKNIDHIVDTFVSYGKNIQPKGYMIINADDSNAQKVINNTNANVITFAVDKKSPLYSRKYLLHPGRLSKVYVKYKRRIPISCTVERNGKTQCV